MSAREFWDDESASRYKCPWDEVTHDGERDSVASDCGRMSSPFPGVFVLLYGGSRHTEVS